MRPHRVVFSAWLAVLYTAWSAAWVLHEFLRDGLLLELRDLGADTLFWLFAKIAAWIVPVGWVLRRTVRTSDPPGWLGLRSAPELGLSIGVAALWLAGQATIAFTFWGFPRPAHFDAALLNAIVVAPLFEEIVFRGFALRLLVDGGTRPLLAVGVTSAAWAFLHVPGWLFQHVPLVGMGVQGLGIVLFGFLLGVLRLRSRSLYEPIFVHFINNAWHSGLLVLAWRH